MGFLQSLRDMHWVLAPHLPRSANAHAADDGLQNETAAGQSIEDPVSSHDTSSSLSFFSKFAKNW
ncbi:hypothetical protein ABTP20_19025, partial [Acinetobacter baumannii]